MQIFWARVGIGAGIGMASLYPSLRSEEDNVEDDIPKGLPVEPDIPRGVLVEPGVPVYDDVPDDSNQQALLQAPQFRGDSSALLSKSVEPNVLSAACIFSLAVVCDALTGLEPLAGSADAPVSLRASSIVCVAMLGSPAIRGVAVADQRFVLGVILAALSFWGERRATLPTRTGDAAYCAFVLLGAIVVCNTGGIETNEVRPDAKAFNDSKHRRQTVSGLCAALLAYVALRGLRMAYLSSDDALGFEAEFTLIGQATRARGYAVSSVWQTVGLAAGHGICLALAAVVGLRSEPHLVGSSAVAFEVGAGGVAVAVAALYSLLGQSEQFDQLPQLFGSAACLGDASICSQAYIARRFSLANSCSASLWLAALGCMAYSFAMEKRVWTSRRTRAEMMWTRSEGFSAGLLLAGSAIAFFPEFGSFQGAQYHTDIVLAISIGSCFVSAFQDTLTGSSLFVLALGYEEWMLVRNYGFNKVFEHLTHCTLALSLAVMALHLVFDIVQWLIETRFELARTSIVNRVLGVLSVFGTSITTALYIASALLLACSNGSLPKEADLFRDGSGKRTMIAFTLDHFVPLFAFLPLYSCRCEVQYLSSRLRAVVWLSAVPILVLVYAFVLSRITSTAPATLVVDTAPMAVALVPALAGWAAGGFV